MITEQLTHPALPKKKQGPAFLLRRHGVAVPSSELIERRIGEHERELELRDRLAEHEEVDRRAELDFGEYVSEQRAVGRRGIQDRQRLLPDRFVPRPGRRVRKRHSQALPVVELAEVRSQPWVRKLLDALDGVCNVAESTDRVVKRQARPRARFAGAQVP